MVRSYKYAVVRLAAHPIRGERLNVGLLIFSGDGLDVRVARRLDKLRALSAALDADRVRASVERLRNEDATLRAEGIVDPLARLHELSSFSAVSFSSLGEFNSPSSIAYENTVAHLLQTLVEPEPGPARAIKKRTKLLSFVKSAFKSEGILARKGEDLTTHRVVSNVKIAEGLSADLVLKNGAMHIFETVDASSEDFSFRKIVSDIAVSALVLEQARMSFGNNMTRGRIIYDASAQMEAIAMPSLNAAAHQGAELVNWASDADRFKFIEHVTSLAVPIEKKWKKSSGSINASVQHRFDLN